MKTRISIFSAVGVMSCFLFVGLLSPIAADYDYYADRLSREHRVAHEVDEWIERGSATITASPRFEDGIRLTAWANAAQNTDEYEFAIASAVYLFEIPVGTQYIEILVRYRGEPHHLEIEDYEEPIAGRAWIRNTKREATRRGYYDENANETRYGDTFVLRAKNRSERLKIPAVGHVKDGWMELHIVAEGGEQIDVEHIEVSTYRRQPKVRVIQRYTPTYRWRPWHRYTYLYFYDGPVYYATDYDYYLRWSYPRYDHHYLSIRSYYGGYLGRYRGYHPSAYYRYYSPYSYYRGTPKVYQRRTRLNKWSTQHEATRRQYSRSRLSANSRQTDRSVVRRSVRTTLENHRKQTPATTERVARRTIIAQKQRALAAASTLHQSSVRRSVYAPENTVSKQRRYSDAPTARSTNRYSRSVETRRTTPLYRRPTPTSSSRSYAPSTSSGAGSQYRSTTSSTRSSRTNTSVSRSSTSRERTSVSRSASSSRSRTSVSRSASSSRSRTSASRSTATKTRTRPTTSSTSVSRSSSSSKDDDDKRSSSSSSSRSRTTERTKRRR